MIILAIDLGKFNSMCCFFDTTTQEYRFQAAATTRSYLTAVLTKHEIDLVVMEACGPVGDAPRWHLVEGRAQLKFCFVEIPVRWPCSS